MSSSVIACWPSALASFVAVSLFTFAGHTEVVSVVRSMGEEAPRYRAIASAVLLVCVPLIMGFGAAAASCMGRRTPSNVLLGLHSELGTWAKLFMSLAIFFSLPVKMFPAATQVERLILRPDGPFWRRSLMCVGLAVTSSVLAIALPDFGFLLAFIGAPIIGALSDVVGRKHLFLTCVLGTASPYAALGLGCSATPTGVFNGSVTPPGYLFAGLDGWLFTGHAVQL